MTQSFDVDPVRVSQSQAQTILDRLSAPLANPWALAKTLSKLLIIGFVAALAFVGLVLWGATQPTARMALPDDISQIRLIYVDTVGRSNQRMASSALLLTDAGAKAVVAIANGALASKSWHQVIKGIVTCELQLMFLDSNANVRRTLSIQQVGDDLIVYDSKWTQPLRGTDPVRFLAVVPRSRLSAMRSEACASEKNSK